MNPRPAWPWRLLAYATLGVLTLVVLFPIYAVLLVSLSRAPGFSGVLSPAWSELTLDHYREFLGSTDAAGRWLFLRQLGNSLLVSGGATLVGVSLAASAAYAFSRLPFIGKAAALRLFLVTQMFPATMLVVPLYLIVNALGLVDTVLGLVLAYATTALPFCVWNLKGYIDTIPVDLDDAALIDGASRWQVFFKIILPLTKPALAITALFSFLSAWNEFIMAATFLSRQEAFTLPVTLYRHVGSYGADWGAFAAGSLVVSVPVCALFLLLQRNLVGGLASGAVK